MNMTRGTALIAAATLWMVASATAWGQSAASTKAVASDRPVRSSATPMLPRTPDGQPNISGIWTNFDPTPFEAPDPAEDAKRLAALRHWFPANDGTAPSVDFDDGPAAAKRNPLRRSLVIDPPNGRVPIRPEAAATKDY